MKCVKCPNCGEKLDISEFSLEEWGFCPLCEEWFSIRELQARNKFERSVEE